MNTACTGFDGLTEFSLTKPVVSMCQAPAPAGGLGQVHLYCMQTEVRLLQGWTKAGSQLLVLYCMCSMRRRAHACPAAGPVSDACAWAAGLPALGAICNTARYICLIAPPSHAGPGRRLLRQRHTRSPAPVLQAVQQFTLKTGQCRPDLADLPAQPAAQPRMPDALTGLLGRSASAAQQASLEAAETSSTASAPARPDAGQAAASLLEAGRPDSAQDLVRSCPWAWVFGGALLCRARAGSMGARK